MEKIILFDGECNFCNRMVQFIIKRDPKGIFKFSSLQSVVGKEMLRKYNVPGNIDSLVLIEDDQCYIRSTAALRIFKNLKGAWRVTKYLLMVPRPIRDFFYSIISKYRYQLFGKKNDCMIPSPEDRKRFL
ncbi:MAG: thiol-disulfide oxidoreductase DCC family protein [Bacillota bacterium]|nr:thiol-disulfide oxidoreductase DCC family protein [Bacillota bacterium]